MVENESEALMRLFVSRRPRHIGVTSWVTGDRRSSTLASHTLICWLAATSLNV